MEDPDNEMYDQDEDAILEDKVKAKPKTINIQKR
jgi:hypothetical protein